MSVVALGSARTPDGPVVDAGGGMSMWFAGDRLCWHLATGGGDCGEQTLPTGRHAGLAGTRELPVERRGGIVTSFTQVMYGIADDRVARVEVVKADGSRAAGKVFARPGLRHRIWVASATGVTQPGMMPSLVFSSSAGSRISEMSPGTLNAARASETFMHARPRPLTLGRPLFRFGSPNRSDNTMHVYQDGDVVGFGISESEPAYAGKGRWFGTVRTLREGSDVPWWYGFMAPQMTRIVARLRDGRVLSPQIAQVGTHRAFAFRLTKVSPNVPKNKAGVLIGYDARGRVLATWKI